MLPSLCAQRTGQFCRCTPPRGSGSARAFRMRPDLCSCRQPNQAAREAERCSCSAISSETSHSRAASSASSAFRLGFATRQSFK